MFAPRSYNVNDNVESKNMSHENKKWVVMVNFEYCIR